MARILNFSDGFSSSEEPTLGSFSPTNSLQSFVDDTAFLLYKGTAVEESDIYFNSTLNLVRFYNGTTWVNVVSTDGTGNVEIPNNLSVQGDLIIHGSTVSVNAANLEVEDSNITLNKGGTDFSAQGAGVTVERTGVDGSIIYDSATVSKWKLGNVGSEVEVADVSSAQSFANKTLTSPVITTPTGITKSDVGLSNVDNTSDATKNAATVVLTNKDIDGGTASNTSRITLPKAAKTTLDGLTRKAGTLVFDTTSNKPYYDDGTNLQLVGSGSGSGGVNYITNPSADDNIAGWSLNNITPAPLPSGTLLGGPAGLTLTRSTTNPLNGTASFELAKDGSNRQGQMVLTNFTVPLKSRAKVLSIKVPYRVVSGTFIAGSSGVDSSLIVYIREFDGTNYTWTQPSSYKFLSNSTTISDEFRAEFQTLSTTISADLVFYVGAFATSAWTIAFDDVSVGPSQYIYGTPITDWVSYTPTFGSLGAVVSVEAYWRRVGDSVQIQMRFTNGTVTGTTATVSMPPGIVGNYTNSMVVGDYGHQGSATGSEIVWDFSNGLRFGGSNWQVYMTGTQMGTGAFTSLNAQVRVAGWSSSVQMSDQNDGRTFSVTLGLTTGQSITSGSAQKVNFDSIWRNTHGTVDTTNKRIKAPLSDWYKIHGQINIDFTTVAANFEIQLRVNGSAVKVQATGKSGPSNTTTSVPFTFNQQLNADDYIEIFINQGSGSTLTIRGDATAGQLSVLHMERDTSGQGTIAATELIAVSASQTSSQSFPHNTRTLINWNTETIDTHGSLSGTTYTAYVAQVVEASIQIGVSGLGSGTQYTLVPAITHTGSVVDERYFELPGTTTSSFLGYPTAAVAPQIFRMKAGDTITASLYHFNGASAAVTAFNGRTFLNIKRIGI